LTRFIFESFTKKIHIVLLITFDPWHLHFEDNIRVLEFSALAKGIKLNTVKKNVQFKEIGDR
jgi:hypothetical protein